MIGHDGCGQKWWKSFPRRGHMCLAVLAVAASRRPADAEPEARNPKALNHPNLAAPEVSKAPQNPEL